MKKLFYFFVLAFLMSLNSFAQNCQTLTFNGTAPIAPTATTPGVGGTGSIQTYTVPAGVTSIRLDAKGAKGGSSLIIGGETLNGGQGRRVQATYAVTPGDVLYILVGGKGGNGSPDNGTPGRTASGGGGATMVSKGPIGSGTLLLVAGGGGGAGRLGGGGNSNNAPNSGSGFNGAGGASFSADGGNSNTSDDCGKGGQALNAGGNGGANTCFRPETNGGGYGGGGAGNYNTGNGNAGGGGGGGYVGGNAGATAGGNGGSSFTDASATNVTTTNHSDDNGSVVISVAATISYTGSPFCKTLTATAAPTTTGYTGGTFSSTAGLTIDATTGVINPSASTPGDYTVSYNTLVGCTAATTTVTVNALPTVSGPANLLDNSTIGQCGKIITYNTSTTGTPMPTITYALSGATIASGSGNGSGSFFNVGETTVTLTATNICRTANYSFIVTILGTPTLTLGTIPAICAGSTSFTIPYTATTRTPTTYSISGTGITSVTDGTLPSGSITVNLSAAASGSSIPFTLTVKNASGCTSANITGSVTVNALPNSYTVTGGGSYCQGGTGSAIGLSGSQVGVSYQLKNGASAVGSPVSGTGSSISFGLQTALGTYTVVATSTIGSCTATMAGSVSVSITYPFSALASSVACSGGSVQLSTTFIPLGAHKWQGPAGYSSNLAKPTVNNMSQAKAGVYTVSITYNNCISSASVSVSVPAPQMASVSSNSPVCVGSSIRLSANTVGVDYQWKGPKSFNSSLKTPSVAASNTAQRGIYSLTVTGSTGCYSTATVSVRVQVCSATRIASEEGEEITMEVSTYPNPTSKILTVEVKLAKPSSLNLQLFNATGNTLTEWNLSEESTVHRKEIDLSVYKDGLYLIQAQSKNGKQTKRVMKIE